MTIDLILLLFAISGILLGLVLIIVGRRGRKIDDHPVCPDCRFDLFGLPQNHPQCPECGKFIVPLSEIAIIGNRQRREGVFQVGLVMFSLCAFPMLLLLISSMSGKNYYQYKPLWLLVRESEWADWQVRDDAIAELDRRLATKKLTQGDIDTIAARFIDIFAGKVPQFKAGAHDPFGPVESNMLKWLDAANKAGKLNANLQNSFVQNSVKIVVRARPRVRKGDPLPYMLILYDRWGNSHLGVGDYSINLKLDEQNLPVFVPHLPNWKSPSYTDTNLNCLIKADDPILSSLKPGHHELKVSGKINVVPWVSGKSTRITQPFTVSEYSFVYPFELLDSNQSSSRPIPADQSETAVPQIMLNNVSLGSMTRDGQLVPSLTVYVSRPHQKFPDEKIFYPVAMKVILKQDQQSWELGKIYLSGSVGVCGLTSATPGLKKSGTISIELIPDDSAAALTLDIEEYYGKPIYFTNLKPNWNSNDPVGYILDKIAPDK